MDEPDRIESWKQIAAYLGKSERTVRRWQQVEGLPVHRHLHQQRGSVWAYQKEIDDWLATRRESPEPLVDEPDPVEPESPPPPVQEAKRTRGWIAGVAILAVALAAGFAWSLRSRPVVLPEPEPLTALPGTAYSPAFSPDGRKVAFFWTADSKAMGIYVKEIGSDKVVAVATRGATGDYLYSPAWSPDGKTIAYVRRVFPPGSAFAQHATETETWLCLIGAEGGPERRLIRLAKSVLYYGNHTHLGWSRDGKRIIAPMADGTLRGIFWVPIDGGEPVRLTPAADDPDFAPVLAHDERAFLFMRQHGPPQAAVESLFRQDLDSAGRSRGEPRLLSQTRSMTSGATWMPSGDEILICRADNALFGPFNSRLHRMRAETNQQPVPLGLGHCSNVATFPNPDGSALLAYGSGDNTRSHLWRARLDALDRPERFAPSSRFDAMPSHSPDGSRVAFVSNRGGRPEIWIAARDGTGERKLNGTGYVSSTPKWSADGATILFGLSAPGATHRLYTAPVSAGAPSELPLRDAVSPSWSGDGAAIYYWTGQQLWRAKPDGSGAKTLGTFSVHWMNSGVVTAGERHVFYAQAGKPFALVRHDRESGKEEFIADGLATSFVAASRRSLYFLTQKEKDLYSVPLTGGPARRVGQLEFEEDQGRLILGLSVSPDDREIVWASTAEQRSDILLVRGFR